MYLPHTHQPLLALFNAFHPISEDLQQAIVANSKIITVDKRTSLLRETEISDAIYFIVKGAIRIFYLDRQGEETNTWFLFENQLAISVYSFFTGQPSFENIETLEDCTLIVLKKTKLDWLYENYVEFNIVGRKLTELYYMRNEAQANMLRRLGAKERYLHILKQQPQLLQRVSLGQLSSYLGISAETLSRVRKQV